MNKPKPTKVVVDVELAREQQRLQEMLESGFASLAAGDTVEGDEAFRRMRERIASRRAALDAKSDENEDKDKTPSSGMA